MASSRKKDELENAERAEEEEEESASIRSTLRARLKRGEASQFHVLAASLSEIREEEQESKRKKKKGSKHVKPPFQMRHPSVTNSPTDFWHRLTHPLPRSEDPYFNYHEAHKEVVDIASGRKQVEIPSLKECKEYLKNDEANAYNNRSVGCGNRLWDTILDLVAAVFVYLVNTIGLESIIVLGNTLGATYYFIENAEKFAAKLDFAFLAMAVVFPLTFLVQSTFTRRDAALMRLADFKGAILSACLFTLTCDWAKPDGEPTGGRLALPKNFNAHATKDYRDIVLDVYEYLSMPNISHARNVIFWEKQNATRRVHAIQNDIFKRFNSTIFELSMHTEVMRKYGFPSGEASRLHQYHQYIQQRFEHLRNIKYYRTPQAARSFGRAYILILPWISGPYFSWVYLESTSMPFTYVLAGFTFLILLGLLNAQQELEDPYTSNPRNWMPGIDTIKLDFELAVVLQSIEQYFAGAEVQRLWEESDQGENFHRLLSQAKNLDVHRIEEVDVTD